jgi:hypothetical protein
MFKEQDFVLKIHFSLCNSLLHHFTLPMALICFLASASLPMSINRKQKSKTPLTEERNKFF